MAHKPNNLDPQKTQYLTRPKMHLTYNPNHLNLKPPISGKMKILNCHSNNTSTGDFKLLHFQQHPHPAYLCHFKGFKSIFCHFCVFGGILVILEISRLFQSFWCFQGILDVSGLFWWFYGYCGDFGVDGLVYSIFSGNWFTGKISLNHFTVEGSKILWSK